jgi:hypothetical protein
VLGNAYDADPVMDANLSFAYTPSRSRLIVLLASSVFGFVWLSYLAVTNDSGLILNHAVTLSQRPATVFYVVAAALCLLSAVCPGRLLMARRNERRVVLSTLGLRAPVGRCWSSSEEERFIPLSTIRDLCLQILPYGSSLRVIHDAGKLDIASAMFESKASFPQLVAALSKMTGLEPTQDLFGMYGWRPRQ